MNSRDRFLNSLKREKVDRISVGNAVSIATLDMMDATGYYFPEVHLDAEKMVGLARAGYELLGYDTIAPIFSVQQEAEALGCKVDWGTIDMMPDVKGHLCKEPEDIVIPKDFLDKRSTRVVLDALRLLKNIFDDEVAIVGKVFGPWTLGYHLFGVEEFLISTILAEDKVRKILSILKEVTVIFAKAQIEAGADVLTLADHATGDLCSPMAYRDFLMDVHKELKERISVPIILHICGDTADRMGYIAQTGIDCFHFESKVDPFVAKEIVDDRIILMGNINNPETLLFGTVEDVKEETRRVMSAGIEILAPECAVPLQTPMRNLKAIVDAVEDSQF